MRAIAEILPAAITAVRRRVLERRRYVSALLRWAVWTRDEGLCRYCLRDANWCVFGAQIDHVVPLSRGGETTFTNLVLACWLCNQQKRDRTWTPRPLPKWEEVA